MAMILVAGQRNSLDGTTDDLAQFAEEETKTRKR